MADAAGFTRVRLTAEAGSVTMPVAEFSADYAINEIPRAAVKVAIGWSGSGGSSDVSGLLADLGGPRTPITVMAELTGTDGDQGVIFDGYVTAATLEATAGQSVGVMLTCESKAADLDAGNKLSSVFHAESAQDLWKSASNSSINKAGPGLTDKAYQAIVSGGSDLWGDFMLPLFRVIAESGDRFNTVEFGLSPPNTRALAAFELVNRGGASGPKIKGAFAQAMTGPGQSALPVHILDQSSGQSFWDTMVNVGALWKAACLPRVSDVLYVPFTEAVKSVHKRISIHDYWGSPSSRVVARTPVKGVCLFTDSQSMLKGVSASMRAAGVADMSQFGEPGASGQMLCVTAPSQYVNLVEPSATKEKIDAARATAGSWNKPVQPGYSSAMTAYEMAFPFGGSILDAMAKAMLVTYRYRDRTVTVVGKWRTDICPGSSVAVEVLTGDRKQTSWVYGCVTAVGFIASADQPYIATRITVGFLRDAAEQGGSPLVSDDHPLFESTFTGGGMR